MPVTITSTGVQSDLTDLENDIDAIEVSIAALEANVLVLNVDVQDVFDEANAELTLRETGEVLTADGTEQNTYVSSNPLGVFKPIVEFIDLDLMQAGDALTVRVYYRLAQGGGWERQDVQPYAGADGGLTGGKTIIAVDLYPNRFGCRVTLEQTAGVNRQYLWKWFGES